MSKLNRTEAAKKGADYYLKNQAKCSKLLSEPDNLEYSKIAKEVIGDINNSLNILIMFIGGYKWGAFNIDDLTQQAQTQLETILDQQKE
jgi:hypothetical protein